MRKKAFTIIELLVVVAIIALLSAILFPLFSEAAHVSSNTFNLRQIYQASFAYSQDADDHFAICINGRFRDITNTADGHLTTFGEKRSDQWPLLLMPYLRNRNLFVDPDRGDKYHIWSGKPLATTDPGYNPYANTFRNQNRFPMFGLNYLFIAPMEIPASNLDDQQFTDFAVGVSHSRNEVEDPAGTVYYTASNRGFTPTSNTDSIGTLDTARGFFGVDAPGLWDALISQDHVAPIIFWTGTDCSGDWCGADYDPKKPGVQTRDNFFYKAPLLGVIAGIQKPAPVGNNVVMIDSHIKYMTPAQLTAGTDYLTATPEDGGSGIFGGGARITDKSRYIWNLNDDFYGA